MQGLAGPVALALVGLWVVYLVPQVLRQRQQLLDSRADDRYSGRLRVVAVATRPGRRGRRRPARSGRRRLRRRAGCGGSLSTGPLTSGRGQRVTTMPDPGEGGTTVDRPHASAERVSADAVREVARLRAAHAASTARRATAARRRGRLAALLLVAALAGLAWYLLEPGVRLVLAAAPTVLLAAVVLAGRAAVVSGRRHDAHWSELIAQAESAAVVAHTGAVRAASRRRIAHPGSRPVAGTASRQPADGPTARPVDAPAPARAARGTATRDAAVPSAVTRSADGRTSEPSDPATESVSAAPTVRRDPRSASGPRREHAHDLTAAIPVTGGLVGRAVRPSDAVTDLFATIVADRGETGATARHASAPTPVQQDRGTSAAAVAPATSPVATGDPTSAHRAAESRQVDARPADASPADGRPADDSPVVAGVEDTAAHRWVPVPVPPPAYTLKPAARRMEPRPLDDAPLLDERPTPLAAPSGTRPATSGSIDLDAVLERRRATGA